MAATMVPADSWCMNGYDDFAGNLDFSHVDAALLTSLLDDTQAAAEDYDDERLMGVIQSLEAEIGVEGGGHSKMTCQPSDAGQLDGGGQDVPEFNGLDLRLMEMAVDMEIMEPSFPAAQNDGINYWYHCDDHHEMDGVDEYCSRVHFEDISDYGFLWQETNASSSSLRQG